MFPFWDTSSFWHHCAWHCPLLFLAFLLVYHRVCGVTTDTCFFHTVLSGRGQSAWFSSWCYFKSTPHLSKPSFIQMMLLQTIARKKCFPVLLKNGFGLKLYHVRLAWDNWVVFINIANLQKGGSWQWLLRKGIFPSGSSWREGKYRQSSTWTPGSKPTKVQAQKSPRRMANVVISHLLMKKDVNIWHPWTWSTKLRKGTRKDQNTRAGLCEIQQGMPISQWGIQ